MVTGWHEYRLKEKLKETKKALKEWSKNLVLEVDSNIQRCMESIATIDLKGEVNSLSTKDVESRRNNFLKLWKY